jgi:hypothetical protein
MYIGPTVARMGLKSNTIIRGSTPIPQLKNIIDIQPMVAALFIPTVQVGEARKRMKKKGSLEHLAAQKIIEIAKQQQ